MSPTHGQDHHHARADHGAMHHAGMNHGAMDHAGMHHGAHDRHAGHGVHMFRSRFWISLLLTIPTIVWGHMPANLIRGTWRASSSC